MAVRRGRLCLAFTLLVWLVAAVQGEIRFVGQGGHLEDQYPGAPVLLNYGEESRTVSVVHRDALGRKVEKVEVRGQGDGIWKAGEVVGAEAVGLADRESGGWRNYTVGFVFEEDVGVSSWEMAVMYEGGEEEIVEGEWIVAGVVVKDASGEIVSGVGRKEVQIGEGWEGGKVELSVKAVGVDGKVVEGGEGVEVVVRDRSGTEYRQVDKGVQVVDGKMTVLVEKWRVGSGELVAEIDAPGIETEGEIAETEVRFTIGSSDLRENGVLKTSPPFVVVGDKIARDKRGFVTVTMFNLLSPPAKEDVKECVLQIGDDEVRMDVEKSKLVQPDQLVVFDVGDRTGEGKIVCDGAKAEVVGGEGGKFTVPGSTERSRDDGKERPDSSSGSAPKASSASGSDEVIATGGAESSRRNETVVPGAPASEGREGGKEKRARDGGQSDSQVNKTLAAGNLEPRLPSKRGSERLLSQLRIVSADPSSYTVNEAADVLEAVCFFTSGSDCSLVRVTKGSAILDVENYVDAGTEEEASAKLREAVKKCDLQKRIRVPCREVQLKESRVADESAVTAEDGGKSTKQRRGLSRLGVVLASACGGIAIILLVVAALWVVYRRSAEQSESDFSSAGPVGVPETDDVLYQQAIVRDIYGRGDFSAAGGGITVEAAEQSRREDELREVAVAPPSSSGASSFLNAHTDDVSSTYSV